MATMVKEKDRERKKSKQKDATKASAREVITNFPNLEEQRECFKSTDSKKPHINNLHISEGETLEDENVIRDPIQSTSKNLFKQELPSHLPCTPHTECVGIVQNSVPSHDSDLNIINTQLEMLVIPDDHSASVSSTSEIEFSHNTMDINLTKKDQTEPLLENVIPSAPMPEENFEPQAPYEDVIQESKPKTQCMPIEQAVRIYGGAEMDAVRTMSEKEELIVEAGPISGPEHPLVDLLSTFRSSLRALDNERAKLTTGFHNEEMSRSLLWSIEKRCINKQIECKCKTMVTLNATYEHATFLNDRLPVARLRLESLLRDVQDSYCHHQHSALLAHCQIEEFISETLTSNKPIIREALSLVLQALRMSDSPLLAAALRRWAAALVAALVDQRDVRQILFVIHHLFRQSRSVVWAAKVIHPGAGSPTTLAVLDTLLAGVRDSATECFEDMEEAWEEVSASGGSGAVSEHALRERDLLALVHVFPLRDIVAKIVSIPHTDIRKAEAHLWGETRGGRDVIATCCGVRTLLLTLRRAVHAHPTYHKLHARLRSVAVAVLQALACLYRSPRVPYEASLQESICAELEACFTAAFSLFGTHDLDKLDTTLLSHDAARDYCLTFIVGLHDTSARRIESLSVEAPALACARRVRAVSHAAAARTSDHRLAAIVLDLLLCDVTDTSARRIESLSVEAPALACARRVRAVSHAAAARTSDHRLAAIVLDLLLCDVTDTSARRIESLSVEAPALACARRVRAVSHAAAARTSDHRLAAIVLDLLLCDVTDTSARRIESLSVEAPALACARRVRAVSHAAAARTSDHRLAAIVLDLLLCDVTDTSARRIESLSVEAPALACARRVRAVSHAAAARTSDHRLAAIVLDLLLCDVTDTSARRIESLSVEAPALACARRVRAVSHAAAARTSDHRLAAIVLDLLLCDVTDTSARRIESLSVEAPALACARRVRAVSHAAAARTSDHRLAAIVLDLLLCDVTDTSARRIESLSVEAPALACARRVRAVSHAAAARTSDHRLAAIVLDLLLCDVTDTSARRIESLSVEAPALACARRVRAVSHAAAARTSDHRLAAIVLDFLLQTGVKNKSPICSSGCSSEARTCLPRLLAAHPYLRTTALCSLAETAKAESLEPSVVSVLEVKHWRPLPDEAVNLLNDWSQRCPTLVPELLMQLDYTPFTGISHPTQVAVLKFVCGWAGPPEARWRVIRRLRTHAAWWGGAAPCLPAPEAPPTDLFEHAFALLATEWGHSIPLICSHGVESLLSLSSGRVQEAVHCLSPVMLLMAHSPESITLTPKFDEVFSSLLNSGPTLVQRALGRGGATGSDLLLKLALTQIEGQPAGSEYRRGVVGAWLRALSGAPADLVAAAHRDWPALDRHAALTLQDKNAKEYVANAVRNASAAPLLCECVLRAYHTHYEFNTRMFGAVANIIWQQHINGHRIHVDNALQKLNISSSSEELVIYRSAWAALVAPLRHPAHLTLWRLFFHLYLQRPPDNMHETAVPVGPLFFSGLKKSRTIAQLKKRLHEAVQYHKNKAQMYMKTHSEESQPESSGSVERSDSKNFENSLLPELSIKDFTGESEEDSDIDSSDDEIEVKVKVVDSRDEEISTDVLCMASYHTRAERMLAEYLVWLEAGDRVRASHYHADITRFIPEKELEQAWREYVKSSRPPPSEEEEFPLPAPPPAPPPSADHSHLAQAVHAIMKIKDKSGLKSRRLIQSPLGEVQFKDTRRLLLAIDRHLDDIDRLAKEWCGEVSRVSSLDAELWRLTAVLRVPRPLPPVSRVCTNKERKCKPVTFHFDEREWCISTGAERGIKENRCSWRAAVRRLSRPRAGAVRTAAALHSIARRVGDSGAAACAVERAFARAERACPAARAARAAFVDELAQRWISHNGRVCAELLSRWCSKHTDNTDHSLCGYLISPHRVDKADWPLIYNVLLDATIPPHTLFSYLSKFDMSSWAKSATPEARHNLLSSIITTYCRLGPVPSNHQTVVLELLAVHTTAVLDCRDTCWVVWRLSQTSAEGTLPPLIWSHVVRAVEAIATDVAFDDLGHLLRQLGEVWCEARAAARSTPVPPSAYAPHVAALLRALLRAFVAAAVTLSYHPVRVGACAWEAAQQSWGAWVRPCPRSPPLLSSLGADDAHHTAMLDQFLICLQLIIDICPESASSVLPSVFVWASEAHSRAQAGAEARVQAAALLAALARLPWDRPWLNATAIDRALQIYGSGDKEIQWWCSLVLRDVTAADMLRDVTPDHVPARLASLLYLWTATDMHYPQVLEQATLLPWWQLPEEPLATAIEAFFHTHYNSTIPYHELPQFRVFLYASELCVHSAGVGSSVTRSKRSLLVTQFTHAASAPAAHAHVHAHVAAILDTIDNIAPCVEPSSGELEELVMRATVILCVEPAATAALPVWLQWVGASGGAVCGACVSACVALTSHSHAPALADAAVKRHLSLNECGWVEVSSRWLSSSPWQEAHTFSLRSRLHAAYACALAHTHRYNKTLFTSLQDVKINFIEEEAIVAVWICYACRVALECSATSATYDVSATSAVEELRNAACSLIERWAQTPRLNILRVVTLQPDTDHTTAHHRALCRLAQCIISPSPESANLYSTALTSLGTIANIADIASWGTKAEPKLLPRLAARFYPKHERYFVVELYNASGHA